METKGNVIETEHFIKIPVKLSEHTYPNGQKSFVISTTQESKLIIRNPIVSGGETLEQAEYSFITNLTVLNMYNQKRAIKCNRVSPWECHPKTIFTNGGWFTIFGIGLKFRIGVRKHMKGGKFIPFTKMNIVIINHWNNFKK